jgi:hypothetical protein
MSNFKILRYLHQVGPKDYDSQNFSFLARKGEAVGVMKIFANGNGKFSIAQIITFLP